MNESRAIACKKNNKKKETKTKNEMLKQTDMTSRKMTKSD